MLSSRRFATPSRGTGGAGSAQSGSRSDVIGTTLGHYRIVEHLGGGGMGVVYKAEDTKLGRTVALKLLPPEWSRDPDARDRFLREARAASALDHPHICTVHDVDETADGQMYIVMACYEGESLKKKLDAGPLPLVTAVDLAIQVADGLDRAHAAGIVHRDIKPANVMITAGRQVKIVDFGLAKLAGATALTQAGTTVGTTFYMSPEQAMGEEVDHRTDLWSLGVLLYEMVTGKRPFRGESADAVIHAILHEPRQAVAEVVPDAPPVLLEIIDRALQNDPEQRCASAAAMRADLRRLQASLEHSGLEATGAVSPGGSRSRRPGVLWLLAGVAIAVGAVIGWQRLTRDVGGRAPGREPRIVVLPFENLGPSEVAYFADGMTEEITARLATVKGFRVISRTSAVQYAGTDKSLRQIGAELDVDYVLEGTVRWAPEPAGSVRIRITPQLIRVADDTHLWAERYDRVLDDVFDIQTEIATSVMDELGVTLAGSERGLVEARPTSNVEAYQAYLRGRYWVTRPHFTYDNWERYMAAFERAVELDPGFALAHAELARGHALARYLQHDLTAAGLRLADAAAVRAEALAPESPRVRLDLGYYHLWAYRDIDAAQAEWERAAAGRPDDAEVLEAKAYTYFQQGRMDEALDAFERAIALSPRDADPISEASWLLCITRRYGEAMRAAEAAIALAPDTIWPYLFKVMITWSSTGEAAGARPALASILEVQEDWVRWAWYWQEMYEGRFQAAIDRLESSGETWIRIKIAVRPHALLAAYSHARLGQPERASAAVETARVLLEPEVATSPEDPRLHSSLGIVYALQGRREAAVGEGQRACALLPREKDGFYYLPYVVDLAHIYTIIGDHDLALETLEQLLTNPSWISAPFLRMDPRWAPLRDDPRFQALLARYEVRQ